MNNDTLDGFLQEMVKQGHDLAFAQGAAIELGLMKSAEILAREDATLERVNQVLKQASAPEISSFDELADRLMEESSSVKQAFQKEAIEQGYTQEWVEGVFKEASLICEAWFAPVEKQALMNPMKLLGAGEDVAGAVGKWFHSGSSVGPVNAAALPGRIEKQVFSPTNPMSSQQPIHPQGQIPGPATPPPAVSASMQGKHVAQPAVPSTPQAALPAPGQSVPQATPPATGGLPTPQGPQSALGQRPQAPPLQNGVAQPTAPGISGGQPPVPPGTLPFPNLPGPSSYGPNGNPLPSSASVAPATSGLWNKAKSFMQNGASWPTALTVGGGVGAFNLPAGLATATALKFPKTTLGLGAGVGAAGLGAGYVANKLTGGMASPFSQWDGGSAPDASGLAGNRNRVMPGMSNQFLGGAAGAVLLPMLAKSLGLEGIPPALLMALGGYGGYKLLPYLMNKMHDGAGQGANQEPYQQFLSRMHNTAGPESQYPGMSQFTGNYPTQ
jgi:hypothetical protein